MHFKINIQIKYQRTQVLTCDCREIFRPVAPAGYFYNPQLTE